MMSQNKSYARYLKERQRKTKESKSKPISIDKQNRMKELHDEEMKMTNFSKMRALRPTLKDLKQKYTDNEMGNYSINKSPVRTKHLK